MEDEKKLLSEIIAEFRKSGLTAGRATITIYDSRTASIKGNEKVQLSSDHRTSLTCDGFRDGKLISEVFDAEHDSPSDIAAKIAVDVKNGRPYSDTWFPKVNTRLGKSDSYAAKLDETKNEVLELLAEKAKEQIAEADRSITDIDIALTYWKDQSFLKSFNPQLQPEEVADLKARRNGLKLSVRFAIDYQGKKIEISGNQSAHKNFDNLEVPAFTSSLVRRAKLLVDAKPAPRYAGSIIVCPELAAILLKHACSELDGSCYYAGDSIYEGKLGTDVFSPSLIVINDPFIASDYARSFDSEGYPTEKFMAIDHGKLRCLFLDNAFGEKLKSETNGCADGDKRNCQYLVVTPSDRSLNEMISAEKNGVIVENVDFKSLVLKSLKDTEFSIQFYGWTIVDGKRDQPIKGRLTGNPQTAMSSIESMSRERGDFHGCLIPWMKIADLKID
ncbi:MAG TPA: hypothetical protein DEA32_02770 [Firmicutes bacterium]|nr:hypothetical protein [Bacillota bacterium]